MTAVAVDLHAHTVASGHAFSTLDELAGVAAVCGLEMIAITDHGPSMEGSPHDGYFEMVGRVPSVVGALARWALPVADTFAGIKYAARRLAPQLLG